MAWTVKPTIAGPFLVFSEEALNSSNKNLLQSDFPPYVGEVEITGIRIEYTPTATAGTREVRVQLFDTDDNDILYESRVGTTTASTAKNFDVVVSGTAFTPFSFGSAPATEITWIPTIYLATGFGLKIYDSGAFDPTADDVIIHVRAVPV